MDRANPSHCLSHGPPPAAACVLRRSSTGLPPRMRCTGRPTCRCAGRWRCWCGCCPCCCCCCCCCCLPHVRNAQVDSEMANLPSCTPWVARRKAVCSPLPLRPPATPPALLAVPADLQPAREVDAGGAGHGAACVRQAQRPHPGATKDMHAYVRQAAVLTMELQASGRHDVPMQCKPCMRVWRVQAHSL